MGEIGGTSFRIRCAKMQRRGDSRIPEYVGSISTFMDMLG